MNIFKSIEVRRLIKSRTFIDKNREEKTKTQDRLLKYLFTVVALLSLLGCKDNEYKNAQIQIQNHHGIFFKEDHDLYPIYALKSIDSTNLSQEKLSDASLLEVFYEEKNNLDIPINELAVNKDLKVYFNHNFNNYNKVHVIYSDTEKEIITPLEWRKEDTIQFDLHNLKKDVVYTFQVTYINEKASLAEDLEIYMFQAIFKS